MANNLHDKTHIATTYDNHLNNNTVNVLFGLSGNSIGFLNEFEASLKSVLMNAPLDHGLQIFMADNAAFVALHTDILWNRTNLASWRTRHPITITVYNFEPYLADWGAYVKKILEGAKASTSGSMHHTVGAWFRLFAYQVLPIDTIEHVAYLDTDVIVMANLEDLWRQIKPGPLFYWYRKMRCSGFLVINLRKTAEIWRLAGQQDLGALSRAQDQKADDQLVFKSIQEYNSSLVGDLHEAWGIHIANGIWKFHKDLVKNRPQLAMIHFNGGGDSKNAFFDPPSAYMEKDLYAKTFQQVKYFIRQPWEWARFQALSQTKDGVGYPLTIVQHDRHEVAQMRRNRSVG